MKQYQGDGKAGKRSKVVLLQSLLLVCFLVLLGCGFHRDVTGSKMMRISIDSTCLFRLNTMMNPHHGEKLTIDDHT
jgi:hypothetical protein